MRLLPLALLSICALTGCAGNVADYIGSRPDIVAPQLARYGMDPDETQCVAGRLAEGLTPLQLRQLTRSISAVRQGYFDPERLTVRDLMHVASSMGDPQLRLELARATEGCGVGSEPQIVSVAPPSPAAAASEVPLPSAWLNLGAAPTGQSIAVDASTLEQEGGARRAWFRLTNPDETEPTGVVYLLRIDCPGRTLEALAHRRQDETGTVSDHREYARDPAGPIPIEGGTVMEIAYLALCT